MSNARQVDVLLSGIIGLDGAPLSGGKVYCYNAGSSTLKNLYNDVGLTVASENPVILDENGRAIKYALGSYKLVIKDSNDSVIYTFDNLTYGFNPSSVSADYLGSVYLSSVGGDSTNIQGSTDLTTPISSLSAGRRFVILMPFDCSANATLEIDSATAVPLYISDGSAAVDAGYMAENQFYEVIYDGSVFRALSTTASLTSDRIGLGSIDSSMLQSDSVGYAQIQDDSIDSSKIAAGGVETVDIADGNITTVKIADENVTTAKLDDGAVTTVKIADANITTAKILDSNVTTAKIADANITTAKIADSNVTTAKIDSKAVTTAKIDDKAVTATQIANNTITKTQIASKTITASEIADTTITGGKLVNNTITATQIANNTITATQIANSTITAPQLASNAVETAKIKDSAVTTAKINNGAVTTVKIADGNVTDAKLASSFIKNNASSATITNLSADTVYAAKNFKVNPSGLSLQIANTITPDGGKNTLYIYPSGSTPTWSYYSVKMTNYTNGELVYFMNNTNIDAHIFPATIQTGHINTGVVPAYTGAVLVCLSSTDVMVC